MSRLVWRCLVIEAMLAMLVARLLLMVVPFARLAGRWGPFTPPDRAPVMAITVAQTALVRRIAGSIASGARHLPFDASCLVRAAAAHALLRRRGIAHNLHLGAAQGQQDSAETHAWLDAGAMRVTGYPLPEGMVELACFPWAAPVSK